MKLDILKGHWVDMLFEGRNKKYGAYVLRKESPKTTMIAWIIGASLFTSLLALPLINWKGTEENVEEEVVLVKASDIKAPPPEEAKPLVPPPPPPPPAPKIDEVKFVKPKVVERSQVVEEIKTIEELKNANVGSQDVKGRADGKVAQDEGPSGEGPATSVAEVIEDNTVYTAVEVNAEYPGGNKKIAEFIQRNFRAPEDSQGGKIFVQFIVEKDGSLTDIQVVRGLDNDSNKEALRVVKMMPKWKPAIQNGHEVRLKFMLPINIQAPTN